MQIRILAASAAITVAIFTAALAAPPPEAPPITAAPALLGSAVQGKNYKVETPVASDGLLYVFKLDTPYGNYTVFGEQLLKLRLHELAALEKLQELSQSEEFTKSLASSIQQPVETVGKTLSNPFSLITGTVSGVGEVFNKVSAGLHDPYDKREKAIDGLLGTSAALRQLAYQYDVDPYTTFPALAARLRDISKARAFGGLAVKGAEMAIPGAAGLAVSGLQSAGALGALVRDKTVSELDQINQAGLVKMGVDARVIDTFMSNQNYTPADKTLIVAALASMDGVDDRTLYVAKISGAHSVDIAFFHRLQTQWIAAYHQKIAPLKAFVSALGFPLVLRADGKLVGLFPIDTLAWTEETQKAAAAINDRVKSERSNGLELRISGTVTDDAKKGLAKLGWKIHEKDTGLLDGR
ncbi:hypothetical protein FHS85_001573 [Rhodoligotrophos appendicifer]